MERIELYGHITPCGGLPYADLVYIISYMKVKDESIRYLLLNRAALSSGFGREDWLVLARSAVFVSGSPLTALTIESWLVGKEAMSAVELKSFLENIQFDDGSQATIFLSQSGDIFISE